MTIFADLITFAFVGLAMSLIGQGIRGIKDTGPIIGTVLMTIGTVTMVVCLIALFVIRVIIYARP